MEYIDRGLALLRAMGMPGLLALALVDSAGVLTGGAPDMLILVQGAQARGMAEGLVIALVAVVGSTLGCLVLYALGRRGGRPALARFGAGRQERIRSQIGQYGMWAMVLAVLAPPPYPMKPFVLAAGVFRIPLKAFVGGVVVGRSVRYAAVSYLAVHYGEGAGALLRAHYPAATAAFVGAIALSLGTRWWRRIGTAGEPGRAVGKQAKSAV